mmetsp:Transcript_5863/g.6511  ORF Transcript_5863/g.6511 Transcript_5863/m.6511 type:complete len:93 (-) Transcript_5863:236-514(-)
MKQMDSNAEFTSSNLDGCDVAYPTIQNIKQTKKTAPGTMPSASGTGLSAKSVPLFPRSLPQIPFRSVYSFIFGTNRSVKMNPKIPMAKYATS